MVVVRVSAVPVVRPRPEHVAAAAAAVANASIRIRHCHTTAQPVEAQWQLECIMVAHSHTLSADPQPRMPPRTIGGLCPVNSFMPDQKPETRASIHLFWTVHHAAVAVLIS